MSLFSSILGGQGATPIGSPQAITTTEIPKQLAPYYTDILGKAQALYNKRTDEGYKPYEGPTIAQYTPEQEATFTGIAGLQGQVAPKFAEAEQMTRDAAGAITGSEIQEAMSPYQQAVTDIEKRESQKSFEQNVLPKLRAAQVAQGSFGGTRGTLLEAQALGDQQRMLGDIQTKGSAAAFKDARAALDAQRLRQGQGATQLANIAPASLSNQLKELGAQQTVGETKQRQAQTALDEAYRQFQLEKQEPYDAMSKYQSIVTGAPLGSTQYAPPAPPGPSLGQTLIGGAGTAAGLYGAFTGQNPLAAVGLMGKKEGGPIIKRNMSGLAGLLEIFGKKDDKDKSDAIQDRVNLDDTIASQVKPDVIPPGGEFAGIPTGELIVPGKKKTIKLEGVYPDKKTIEEQSNIKTDKQVKGGIADTRPVQRPSAPTKAQLREQNIRAKEQGLKSLYGQYAETGKRDMAAAKDARFREQSFNIAKAFAQFATRGGGENALQKAIATAGDNIDQFVATDKGYRKDVKDIENKLQQGKLQEAKLDYDIVKDRADRELNQEDRDISAEQRKKAEAWKNKTFNLQEKELDAKLRENELKLQAILKKDPAKSGDFSEARKSILQNVGVTISGGQYAIIGGNPLDDAAQKQLNHALKVTNIEIANLGSLADYYKSGKYDEVMNHINNVILKKDNTSSEDNTSNNNTGGNNIEAGNILKDAK
jgi:hypothetical protein